MRNAATAYRRSTVCILTIVVALVATAVPLGASVRMSGSTSGASPGTTIPSGLTLAGTSATSISLSWKASRPRSAVAGYRLYRDGVLVGSTTNTVATYANLSCGRSYDLGVASFNASGGASGVATVLASTSACPDITPPTTPSSLTVAAFDQTTISLNWKPSTDASNSVLYELYQDGTRVVVTAGTNWIFDTLKCGMSYTLGVVGYDSAGNRSPTATVIAGTAPCSFTVAPSVSITGKPIDGTTATDATFMFSSTGATQLECRLDSAVFETCASPKSYSGVAAGTHTFTVRATNAAGSATASASWTISASPAAPAPALPPSNTSLPTISGASTDGAQLSEGGDTWTGTDPISYGYQWRRCDNLGANCASIAGATAKTYLLTASDVGTAIRVAVTASNVAGSSTVTSAATTVAAAAPAAFSGPAIGTQFHCNWNFYTDPDRLAVLDKLKAAGVTWVRIDTSWAGIEASAKGDRNAWYLRMVDFCVNAAHQRGINVLMTLWLTPAWANGGRGERVPPTNPADYADFARWAAEYWKGRVNAWEVWNEPDPVQTFWQGTTSQYVDLLKAAYPKFKAGDPSAPVVLGGPSSNDDAWIESVYSLGAKSSFDVLATHPYQGLADAPPEYPDDGNRWWFTHLPAVRNVMAKYGDAGKPIWFTEFGWSAHDNWAGIGNWQRGVTPAQQGDYFIRAIKYTQTNYPYVPVMFWYKERAQPGSTNVHYEGYALLNADLSERPVYSALKSFLVG